MRAWAREPGENDMRTWTLRLGLSLVAAAAFGMNRLPAQDVAPLAKQIVVVPAVPYEPAQPARDPYPAKSPIVPVDYKGPADEPTHPAPIDFKPDTGIPAPRFWARGEYLLWWVKDAPLPVPIVTTGNPNVGFPTLNTAGGINQGGTQVLLGDGPYDFGAFSGMRFTVGGWIDEDRTIGLEASGFMLERRPYNFSAGSDGSPNSLTLYLPRFNPSAHIEDAIPIADPLRGFAGDVFASASLQFWGTEANGLFNVWRQPGMEFTLLAGFRYADLRETFNLHNTTTDLVADNVMIINDSFGTRNQFYGGQVGGQLVCESHGFSLDVTGKVAFGTTQQMIDVQGNTSQTGPNPLIPPGLGTVPGGFFTQPSNIGHYSGSQFTVMPSFELNLSYQVTNELRAFIGYTFMYWSGVVRPGDQINHNINVTQNAVLDPNGTGQLVGPGQPAPLFNRTDFWAHGLNFGLEFRF
jgi:hypothetical protein